MTIQILLTLLLVLVFAGSIYEKIIGADTYDRIQPSGRRVDIGGQRLYAKVQGERRPGQPLIVLVSGHGDWSKGWTAVQPEIARFARVLAYDRAGSGWSDPGPSPRSPERIVLELHRLLQASGEPGPYLFVGHSMGGPLSRMYYHFYPQEVYGMIWVDSAHENMERFLPFFHKALYGLLASLFVGRVLSQVGLIRLFFKHQMLQAFPTVQAPSAQTELLAQVCGPGFFKWLLAETTGFAHTDFWDNTPHTLGSLPVVSLEAQYPTKNPPIFVIRSWNDFLIGWKAIQADLGTLSSCLRRIPVQTSHAVMFEQPDVIIESVHEMLNRSDPC